MERIASLPAVARLIDLALEEDIGQGDMTTQATVPATVYADGEIVAKARGVIAGLPIAEAIFLRVDPSVGFGALVDDGDLVEERARIAEVSGPARALLTAERVALNFLQQLSGVATATRTLKLLADRADVRIVDTRKTVPGMRVLQRYAVRMGGGHNHRFNLADAVLIKDNHIAACGGIAPAVAAARERIPHTMSVEVEVGTLSELDEALQAGADAILLDNMDTQTMAQAVAKAKGKAILEASGSIDENTIAAVAKTGVDVISCGALTHSARALDLSLEISAR